MKAYTKWHSACTNLNITPLKWMMKWPERKGYGHRREYPPFCLTEIKE